MGNFRNDDPVTRAELHAWRIWVEAELRAIHREVATARKEQEKREKELNDVRQRFLPRGEWDSWVKQWRDKSRATTIALITMGLVVISLAITVIALLASG